MLDSPLPRIDPEAKPCPICGKASTVAATPFCSKRCADVDLHRWLGGVYAVPAEERRQAGSDQAVPDAWDEDEA